jgi:hypothetical protein
MVTPKQSHSEETVLTALRTTGHRTGNGSARSGDGGFLQPQFQHLG